MEFFESNDYRKSLKRSLLERRKQMGLKFTAARMAERIGVQPTYLSNVLNGKAHLSEDQLFLGAKFLKLTRTETDFLMLLRRHQRCQNAELKALYDEQISVIRVDESQLSKQLKVGPAKASIEEYFVDPYCHKIHLFLTVDEYARKPKLIAERLGLTSELLQAKLTKLKELGLIRMESGKIAPLETTMYLSPDSNASLAYRTSLRMLAGAKLQRCNAEDTFISVCFSAGKQSLKEVKKQLTAFLNASQKATTSDEADDVFVLNIDLCSV